MQVNARQLQNHWKQKILFGLLQMQADFLLRNMVLEQLS